MPLRACVGARISRIVEQRSHPRLMDFTNIGVGFPPWQTVTLLY